MINNKSNIEVLLIDPCFSDIGMANNLIPLSVGMLGSYLKKQIPEINVTVLKKSKEIVSFIDKKKPDVVGCTSFLWNANLGNRLSKYARKINPKTFIVFGGPEINKQRSDDKNFIEKYIHADLLVEREGELAFHKILSIYLEENKNSKKVRSRIGELGNCFYIDKNHKLISSPPIHRTKHLDDQPSPYTTGLFDHFLKDKSYQPLIQTNRGCPYSCTFCNEGSEYFNKINFHSLEHVKEELNYIAERVDPSVGVFIADSNWGMFKQDVEIAKHMRDLQEKYHWPMQVACSTGKSQLPRIKSVAEILQNAMKITNAMQSRNDEVLDAIKRKNASNLDDFIQDSDTISSPEIILPLPKETQKSFMNGLNEMLDTKAPLQFTVYPALLLSNTEMNYDVKNKKQDLRTRYRQHQNLAGWIDNEFVCETEKNIISTDTMSEKEVLEARKYSVLMTALLREEPLLEILYYLDSFNIKRSTLPLTLYENINSAPNEIQECFNEYISSINDENFVTEKEVFEYMEKYGDDYIYGRKGGDSLRYSQKFWIDHFDAMIKWIFDNLNTIFENNLERKKELNSINQYLLNLHMDRSKFCKKDPIISKKFDYDIMAWIKSIPIKKTGDFQVKKLNEFDKKVTYQFEETKYSKTPWKIIWKSFGFNLSNNEKDYTKQWVNRLWLSRTQRKVINKENLEIKQRMTHDAIIAEKVGL